MKSENDIEPIYNLYVDDLYAYAIQQGFDRNVVMDAIHDVFYRICNSKTQLDAVGNIRNYLFSALKKTLLNTVRGNKEYLSIDDFPMQEAHYFNIKVSFEDHLISREEEESIRLTISKMLGGLSPRQREIVYLRYIEECSYEEITRKMGIDINSCHKLMHKAMSLLRKQFLTYLPLINNVITLFAAIFSAFKLA